MPFSGDASTVPDTLQYVLHEEGRIRNALKKNNSTGAMYFALEYDYFLKDHLGNIRSVITEGKDTAVYVATMEPAYQTTEQVLFDNEYDPVNTIVAKPSGFDNTGTNTKVVRLNASTGVAKPNGPGLLLKVMAGDKVQLSVYAWYSGTVQGPGGVNPFNDLLSAITGSVIGGSSGKLTSTVNTGVSNAISPNLTTFINGRNYNSTRPKAHLNWILLDEQLTYVQQGSNAVQVPTVIAGAQKQAIAPMLQTMSKSGYLYVYLSNESQMDVYFDDLTVTHYSSALVSEESYYPFGGDMAALKSNAAMKTANRYKFNAGTELNESFDIDYYETYFRNYDAQVGRFTGVDKMSEATMHLTPYQFGANDPIAFNDPMGLLVKTPDQLDGGDAPWEGNWVERSIAELDAQTEYLEGMLASARRGRMEAYLEAMLSESDESANKVITFAIEGSIASQSDGQTGVKTLLDFTAYGSFDVASGNGYMNFIIPKLNAVIHLDFTNSEIGTPVVYLDNDKSATADEVNSLLKTLGYENTVKVQNVKDVLKTSESIYSSTKNEIHKRFKSGTSWFGLVKKSALEEMKKISDGLTGEKQYYFNRFRNEAQKMFFTYNFYGWNPNNKDNIKQVTMEGEKFFVDGTYIYIIYAGINVEYFKKLK